MVTPLIMKDQLYKIKHIYIPFLLISLVTISGYSYFRWFFDIRHNYLKIDVTFLDYWFPVILSVIAAFLIVKPRLNILIPLSVDEEDEESAKTQDNDKNKNLEEIKKEKGLYVIAIFTMAATMCLLQAYMNAANRKHYNVESVADIQSVRHFDYYKFKDFSTIADKDTFFSYRNYYSGNLTPNGNRTHIFMVIPIQDSSLQSNEQNYKYWLADNLISRMYFDDKDSNKTAKEFRGNYTKDYFENQSNNTSYFKVVTQSDERKKYLKAIKKVQQIPNNDYPIILEAEYGTSRYKIAEFKSFTIITFILGNIIFIITLLFYELKKEEDLVELSTDESFVSQQILSFKNEFIVTKLIVLFILIIYVIMMVSGTSVYEMMPETLLKWGGARQAEVMNGDYWRLITAIFVSPGGNQLMILLPFFFGISSLIESEYGSAKLLLLFFAFGIFGNAINISFENKIIIAGLFNIISGFLGSAIALLIFRKSSRWKTFKFIILIFLGLLFPLLIIRINIIPFLLISVIGFMLSSALLLFDNYKNITDEINN